MPLKVFLVLRTILLVYAGLLVIMAGLQRQFIYFPARDSEDTLLDLARSRGLEPWRDHDGGIVGWKSPTSGGTRPSQAIVVFHGNAGHALHRDYYVQGFAANPGSAGWQVHIFEYPGYGARPGSPSEDALKRTAAEAVQLLLDDERDVFLVGESLGSGVACHLAGTYPEDIAGMLLITPFTSLVDVGRHHYPIVPVGLLLRERYDNSRALQDYRGPVAFLLAGRDEVIPTPLGLRLHDQYGGPRSLIVQEDRSHNTLQHHPDATWWREVTDFWLDP